MRPLGSLRAILGALPSAPPVTVVSAFDPTLVADAYSLLWLVRLP